ncbi:MAG: hypothetical protein ABJF01_05220 [bacterium]
MTTPAPDPLANAHVSVGVILALTDSKAGERSAELDAAQDHVDHCDVCWARRVDVESHSDRVRDALSAIPIPSVSENTFRRHLAAGARRTTPLRRRPAWQAAAAVVILSAAAAASPARHWIQSRIEQSRSETSHSPIRVLTPSPQTTNQSATSISFAPAGAVFIVRFDSVPSAGVLYAEGTTQSEITARVVAGGGAESDALVVLPGELRVRNTALSTANYSVWLPPVVKRLRVIIAGRKSFDGPPPAVVHLRPSR